VTFKGVEQLLMPSSERTWTEGVLLEPVTFGGKASPHGLNLSSSLVGLR
jgi:hypothetical protein